jgi:hypothetical protein
MSGQPQAPVNSTSGLYPMHTDHLGTPQVITDANQQIVWRADQTPFGETTVTINTIGSSPTHPPVSHFARIPCSASPVLRHNSPVPRNTGRYPTNRTDSRFQHATDNWTRDTPPDRRSCGHELDLTPHIGNTPTHRRLSLSDWTDSGLPKASPFWIPADSQTGSGAPTTASSMAPIR